MFHQKDSRTIPYERTGSHCQPSKRFDAHHNSSIDPVCGVRPGGIESFQLCELANLL